MLGSREPIGFLKELENYGWQIGEGSVPAGSNTCLEPFEFVPDFNCISFHFFNLAFPEVHIEIEVTFDGLKTTAKLEVIDENIDGAWDSAEVAVFDENTVSMDAIWNVCEEIMFDRDVRYCEYE